MTTKEEQQISKEQSYCEVCGIDVDASTNLKRFGKLFCSESHLNQYLEARQRSMGLMTASDNKTEGQQREEIEYEEDPKRRRKRGWFSGGGCG